LSQSDQEHARRDFESAQRAGLPLLDKIEWLTANQVDSRYGTHFPAVRKPGNNVWPYKLFSKLYKLALSIAPKSLDITLHTSTPVLSITPNPAPNSNNTSNSRRWNVHTPRGSLTCNYIIHATNGYASHLLPHLRGAQGIIPTRGQVIATKATAPARVLTDSAWVGNSALEYWFPLPTPTGSLEEQPIVVLGGAREIPANFELYQTDDSVIVDEIGKGLRKFLPRLFPGKFNEDQVPEKEWTGILGFTKTGSPFVGPVLDPSDIDSKAFKGQFICAGFHGHGMPRTFACAEAVVQMILAEMQGKTDLWQKPSWFPSYYLTSNIYKKQ